MVERDVSRRDVLKSGGVAIGLATAGCTAPASGPGSATLVFENGPEELQRRAETVYDRVRELVGASIQRETSVRVIDTAEMRDRAGAWNPIGETTTQRLAHRALGVVETVEPDVPFEFAGAYYHGSGTIVLVADDESDVDDQLLAHELFHAIQFQTGGVANWEYNWSAGFDQYAAKQSLVEGTAMYVEDEYVGGCEGSYANCHLGDPGRFLPQWIDPEMRIAYGSYMNGHEFAAALAERNGWDSIWAAHDDPPVSTGQILRPEWYPSRRPAAVPTPSEPGGSWTRLDTERLGMQSLFVTLWTEGVLPASEARTGAASDTDAVNSSLVRYRSDVTDRWRGDAFTGYERPDGRYGWRWRIRWADTSAAETGYEHFREWATARGTETTDDAVWEREDGVEALALDGEDLLVGMAPTIDDLDAIAPLLAD